MRTNPTTPPPADARAEFARGIRLGFPIFLGYAPVGLAFGILAVQQGFTVVQAVVCSATALAGAGQFIAVASLAAGAGPMTVIIATSIVNLRYVLFATTLSPYMAAVPLRWQAWLGYTLTDESFAVNVADSRDGHATRYSMAGVGTIAWVGWVAGTVIGAVFSTAIGDPSTWGVDFAMPAMFAALFVALADSRRHVGIGVLAAAIVAGLAALGSVGLRVDSNWYVIIGSLVAATVATLIFPQVDAVAEHEEMLVAPTHLHADSPTQGREG